LFAIPQELLENDLYREMGDVELVLRYFANRQRNTIAKAGGRNYSNFLDFYLKHGNNFSSDTLHKLSNLYEDTIRFVYQLFGEKAFWLYRKRQSGWSWVNRPTTAVYDPLMQTASAFLEQSKYILAKKPKMDEIMVDFYTKNYSSFEGRNTNPSIIVERDNKFQELFNLLTK
jgi:hypothetical protein